MSFTDDLKKSLGFEVSESANKDNRGQSDIVDSIRDIFKPRENPNRQPNNPQQPPRQTPRPQQSPNPRPQPRPTPGYERYEDYVITPEQSFYEIVLIRPKTLDDINYVVDQVIEEKNPVIIDLSFLEKESVHNFRLAGDKIKQMRERYGAQALLLSRTEDKNLIIVSPKKVKVVNKG